MAARNVDDAQAAVAKKRAAIIKKARVVGTAVADSVRHPADNRVGSVNRSIRDEPSNTTHTNLT